MPPTTKQYIKIQNNNKIDLTSKKSLSTRKTVELAAKRLGNRARNRGLTSARRASEAKDFTLREIGELSKHNT